MFKVYTSKIPFPKYEENWTKVTFCLNFINVLHFLFAHRDENKTKI